MKKILILITGLLTTTLALYYVILWFILFKANTGTFEDLKILYLTYYPEFIEGVFSATLLNIMFCLISFFCFGFLYAPHDNSRVKKVAYIFMMIVNIILFSWLLWTMM